jgi:DNA-directed RNA polymerase specialized sigma24 family protein
VTFFEPSRAWQDTLHLRILHEDVTAFAELCDLALPHLVEYLGKYFPGQDTFMHETVAIDCLLDYQSRAKQYDLEKISLYAYLRMAARRDMLNAIEKANRLESRLTDIDHPAVQGLVSEPDAQAESSEIDEWLLEHTDLSLSEIINALNDDLDEYEKKVLMLMLEGVRESENYVSILGVEKYDKETQQKAVKRAKDRLMKKLRRFGQKIKKPE